MNTKIRDYINELFKNAPKTKKVLELKEEMITNAEEKFADLMAEGYREEDSFSVVIHSIGNVEELFHELGRVDGSYSGTTEDEQKFRQKKAKYIAISAGWYIFAGVVFFAFVLLGEPYSYYGSGIDWSLLGLIIGALLCIPPTIIIVYMSMITPKYQKAEESMVEEYKEWKSGSNRDKEVRKAISSIIWTLTVVLYFVLSFRTGSWHITWIIYLIAGCVESLVNLLFNIKKNK